MSKYILVGRNVNNEWLCLGHARYRWLLYKRARWYLNDGWMVRIEEGAGHEPTHLQ